MQDTTDLLALLYRQNLPQVEDSLLPVGVLGVRAGRESDWLVTCGEIDIEPGDQSVDEVVASAVESKGCCEVEILGGTGVEVESDYGKGVGYNSFDLDGINERFGEGALLEG